MSLSLIPSISLHERGRCLQPPKIRGSGVGCINKLDTFSLFAMVPKTLIISNIIGEKNWGDIQDNLFTRKTGKPRFTGGSNADLGKENAVTGV